MGIEFDAISLKRALFLGMSMAIDLSGTMVVRQRPLASDMEAIGHDFERIGESLQMAIEVEAPKIILESEQQQLKLNLPIN